MLACSPWARRIGGHDAVADQVIAGPARQLTGLVFGAGHQQRVLAVEVVREPAPVRLFGCLLGGAAAQPAVLFVVGEHGDVPGAQPQGGVAFPWVGEPLGFGEMDVTEAAGEQHHAAASLDGGELLVIADHDDLAVLGAGQGEDRGHVRQRHHAGLVNHQQRAAADRQRSPGLAAFAEVSEELGRVVRPGQARLGQDVACGLRGGQPDHLTYPGVAPDLGQFGDGSGLARPGRAGHHFGAAAGGEHGVGRGGLIQAQPRRDAFKEEVSSGCLRLGLRLDVRLVCAQQARRGGGLQARGAVLLRVREQALFEGELRAGGVAGRAVRGVQALAGGAAQAVGHARPFRCGWRDRFGAQGLAGQGGEQRGGIGRAHRADVRGQALAKVADQVSFGPGRLGGLHFGDRFGDEALRLRLGQRRGMCLRLGGLAVQLGG